MPGFVAWLREHETVGTLALEFCVLTAARTNEVLGARWDVIDFNEKIWTVSAMRMKAGREHRVPLTGRTIAILEPVDEVDVASVLACLTPV